MKRRDFLKTTGLLAAGAAISHNAIAASAISAVPGSSDYEEGDLNPIQFIEADSLHAAGSADIHVSPDGRFLYASNRLKGDGIAIFEINQEDGKLKRIGYQSTGKHPRNFIITSNGKYLLCACRDNDIIQIFTIDSTTGLLQDTKQTIQRSKPVCLKFTGL